MNRLGGAITLADGTELPLSAGMEIGETVYLSGQLALIDGKLVAGGIVEQTTTVLDNIERLLAEANLTLSDVFKTTVWIVDGSDFAQFNATYSARFSSPYPARSAVVSKLVIPGALVEIEVIASASCKTD
jgi:2-iminobutanoate/2-iminopropanoate deaminase